MKKLFALAVLSAAFVPVLAAQKATGFTGKWEGTFTMQRQDGLIEHPERRLQSDAEGEGAHRYRGSGGQAMEDRQGRRRRRQGHVRSPAARRAAVQVHADDREGASAG